MLVPEPDFVAPPGEAVMVHDPEAGRPLSATLPVLVAQVGCVIVPIIGAEGISYIVTLTA